MKVGRNNPCHCGSGKKYKRCCLDRDSTDSTASKPVIHLPYPETDPAFRTERDEKGRLVGKPFIETEWQGKRVRAVGDLIAMRPPTETDHEFFVSVLCKILGNEWHEAQLRLPEERRHVVERWVAQWDALRRGGREAIDKKQEGEHLYSATATGDLKALLCLAYDVYTLKHAIALPDPLVARLRQGDQFQGTRDELAVAAVFVRAGYQLDWVAATDRKLPEFIARHPQTGNETAVEAKSRHRPGVLGRAGDTPDLESVKVDVAGLMRAALQKETDGRPFVVCLDLNLPTVRQKTFEEWLPELYENVLAQFGTETTGEPDPYAAVFFTNYSWHWDGDRPRREPDALRGAAAEDRDAAARERRGSACRGAVPVRRRSALEEASADVVISNGVVNLSPAKERVFADVARVLRPGGRLAIADIVTNTQLPVSVTCDASLWAACIGGAMQRDDYRDAIETAGFEIEDMKENVQYRFISERAESATSKYGVKSVSLLAVKP